MGLDDVLPPPTRIAPQPDLLVGAYRLLHQIGAGGIGEVWEARHERLDQIAAVKLLGIEHDSDGHWSARMLQEGRALAQLEHPSIVRVYHCDRDPSVGVYLAMELVRGESLREWLRKQSGRVGWTTAADLAKQIAEAMTYVHRLKIVHRDIKPENILIVSSDTPLPEVRVKIIDFGIAKILPTPHLSDTQLETGNALLLGSALYMAPEQCRNAAQVTGAADVYALGVVLFELLAGRPPFVGEPVEVLAHHMGTPSPPLKDFAPDVPATFCALIAAMLDKEPANRPSMQRLAALLADGFSTEAPDACPLPGLLPFAPEQAEWFFGRREELKDLWSLWLQALHGEQRWLQLEGPSGVGKTSLLQAGLMPRIQMAAEKPTVLVVTIRPSGNPIEQLRKELHAALSRQGMSCPADAVDFVVDEPTARFSDFAARYLPSGAILALVVEQFEELLTLGNAARFDALLGSWMNEPGSRVRLISTFRSDFLHRIEQIPKLAAKLNHAARYHVRAVDDLALRQVVDGMAQRSGLRLAAGVAERMVRDAGQSDARLPLLGHALQVLWSLQTGHEVALTSYERIGGVIGALTAQVDLLLDELGPDGATRAKWIVLGLIQPGHGSPDTRRPRACRELLALAGGGREAEATLLALSGTPEGTGAPALRLIALRGAPGSMLQAQEAELVHELLITKVPAIVRWLDEERATLEQCSDVEDAAATWDRAGRPKDGLPAGTLLAHLSGQESKQRLVRRFISERAQNFLSTAHRLDVRQRRFRRGIVMAIAVAAIISGVSANHARKQERAAQESNHHLAIAVSQVASNTDWELAAKPGTLDARRDLLSVLIRELSALPTDTDGSLEITTALVEAHHRRGDLALSNETLTSADSHFRRAEQLLSRIDSSHSSSHSLDLLRALNASKRGKVALAKGQTDLARARFASSVTLLEGMTTSHSTDEAIRCLAVSYGELAATLATLGQPADAANLYARAEVILEKNGGLSNDYDRCLLATNQRDAAEVELERGSLPEASRLIEAARLHVDAVRAAQKSPDLFADATTVRVFVTYGEIAARRDNLEQAHEMLAKATDRAAAVVAVDPTNKGYALNLAQGLSRYEVLLTKQGDPDHARAVRDRRCQIVAGWLLADAEDARFRSLSCKK